MKGLVNKLNTAIRALQAQKDNTVAKLVELETTYTVTKAKHRARLDKTTSELERLQDQLKVELQNEEL